MSQFGKKTINKQVQQLLAKVKQTPVLVASVDLLDKSGAVDVPSNVLKTVADKVCQKHNGTSFMLVTAGKTGCQLLAVSADEQHLSATDWIIACGVNDSDFGNQAQAHGSIVCLSHESTLKRKDELIHLAFEHLRVNGLMPEDESSDEMPMFDINASDNEE